MLADVNDDDFGNNDDKTDVAEDYSDPPYNSIPNLRVLTFGARRGLFIAFCSVQDRSITETSLSQD